MNGLFVAVSMMQGDWNQLMQGAGLFVVESAVDPAMPSVMGLFGPDTGNVPQNLRRT